MCQWSVLLNKHGPLGVSTGTAPPVPLSSGVLLVEHFTRNEGVGCSNLPVGIYFGGVWHEYILLLKKKKVPRRRLSHQCPSHWHE